MEWNGRRMHLPSLGKYHELRDEDDRVDAVADGMLLVVFYSPSAVISLGQVSTP